MLEIASWIKPTPIHEFSNVVLHLRASQLVICFLIGKTKETHGDQVPHWLCVSKSHLLLEIIVPTIFAAWSWDLGLWRLRKPVESMILV